MCSAARILTPVCGHFGAEQAGAGVAVLRQYGHRPPHLILEQPSRLSPTAPAVNYQRLPLGGLAAPHRVADIDDLERIHLAAPLYEGIGVTSTYQHILLTSFNIDKIKLFAIIFPRNAYSVNVLHTEASRANGAFTEHASISSPQPANH